MNKLSVVLIVIFLSSSLNAQIINISERQYFKQFDWEVTSSIALGLSGTSIENTLPDYYGYGSGNEEFYSEISLSLGFFILDGFSFEPELDYNFFSDDATFSLIANVSYTINIPRKSIYPYFKVGYGKSGYTAYNYGYSPDNSEGLFESLDANVINAGAGLKIIQSSTFAMRLELNYKYINYNQTIVTPYTDSYDMSAKTSVLSLKFGGSFLF